MELEESKALLAKHGLGLAAISYDPVAVLKNFADRRKITFPMLSDEGSKTIRAFGVLNTSLQESSPFYGVPHPVTLIVDRNGVVQSKHFEADYRERITVANILSGQLGLRTNAAKSDAIAKHVTVSASASNAKVRPGERIRLFIDLHMRPKMHVYAPSVEGYIPIQWDLAQSAGLRALEMTYPPSKQLHLPAIKETVPVYEGSLTLQREVVIGPAQQIKALLNERSELVIDGSLRYQACDDRLCYVPETVPVRWVLQVEPLDTQRVAPELRSPKLR